jgi:hypothetical protein
MQSGEYIRGMGDVFNEQEFREAPDKLYIPMRTFKTRWVDPSFIKQSGEVVMLSSVDAEFKEALEEHEFHASSTGYRQHAKEIGAKWREYVVLDVDPATKQLLSGYADII